MLCLLSHRSCTGHKFGWVCFSKVLSAPVLTGPQPVSRSEGKQHLGCQGVFQAAWPQEEDFPMMEEAGPIMGRRGRGRGGPPLGRGRSFRGGGRSVLAGLVCQPMQSGKPELVVGFGWGLEPLAYAEGEWEPRTNQKEAATTQAFCLALTPATSED